MVKTKLTLSIDEELVREAKAYLARRKQAVSSAVEGFLVSLVTVGAVEKIMDELSIERKFVSYDEVVKNRPAGGDAGKVVRGQRDEREKSLSR